MNTTTDVQSQIDQIASSMRQIKSQVSTSRLFDLLELLRDAVRDLNHEHDSIRNDVRDIYTMIGSRSNTAL